MTIKGDGSTVVNYYYTRNSYQLTFHPNNEGSDTVPATFKYGALIIAPSVTRAGYTFGGWYDNAAIQRHRLHRNQHHARRESDALRQVDGERGHVHRQALPGDRRRNLYSLFETETFSGTAGSQVTPAVKTYEGSRLPRRRPSPSTATAARSCGTSTGATAMT